MKVRIRTIIAAVDFSPVSAQVVATAARLVRATEGMLVIRHIIQVPVPIVNFQIGTGEIASLVAGIETDADRRIDDLGRSVVGIPVETGCICGEPAIELCRAARDEDAEFIVIGSHGHGSLYELLIGTTTQGVLKGAPCPVIIVPVRENGG